MPEICRFFGIVIAMYYNDHDPPYFHARYGSRKADVYNRAPYPSRARKEAEVRKWVENGNGATR